MTAQTIQCKPPNKTVKFSSAAIKINAIILESVHIYRKKKKKKLHKSYRGVVALLPKCADKMTIDLTALATYILT